MKTGMFACILPLFLVACGDAFPYPIALDTRFTAHETRMIREMMAEMDRLGDLVGEERLVRTNGSFTDADGVFDDTNAMDERYEMYRLDDPSQCRDHVEEYPALGPIEALGGFAHGHDVAIVMFNISDDVTFRHVALHEMGHLYGMHHVDDPDAVMNPFGNPVTAFTTADRREFCHAQGCDADGL